MESIKHIVFFLFLLLEIPAFSQQTEFGTPFIENIPYSQISYEGELGKIEQNAEGLLFIENQYGVLTYDGIEWNLLRTKGEPTICKDMEGSIYVGARNFIGKIVRNEFNQFYIQSLLSDSIPLFGKVVSIEVVKGNVYFFAGKTLYKLVKGVPKKEKELPEFNSMLAKLNQLYISIGNNVYQYNDGEFKPEFKSPALAYDIIKTDKDILLVSNEGLRRENKEKALFPFPTDIDSVINAYEFAGIKRMINNTICIATVDYGVYCIDATGKLLFHVDESNGLADNHIKGMVIDRNDNVWVTTSKGVSRIEMTSAITYFNKNNGLIGVVKTITKNAGKLYVGTDRGIFVLQGNKFQRYTQIPCNALISHKNTLIAGTVYGLTIFGGKTTQIFSENVRLISEADDNHIIVVTDNNIYVFTTSGAYPNLNLKIVKQIPTPNIEITTIASNFSTSKSALVGTRYDGLWMITRDSSQTIVFKKCNWSGIDNKNLERIDVHSTSRGFLVSTPNGIYSCDEENKFFYHSGKINLPERQLRVWASPIVEDKNRNMWMAFRYKGEFGTQIAVAWNTNNLDRFTLITSPFEKIRRFHTDVIYPDDNSIVWLGGVDGIVRMDFNQMSIRKTLGNVILSKITMNGDSLLPQNQRIIKLPHKTKSIVFDFVAAEFENHEDLLYTYFLEGYDNAWSYPTKVNTKEYMNLPTGKYTFHVAAKRNNGAISKETTFSFEIRPNPLLTGWAFAFYSAILIVILIYFLRNYIGMATKNTTIIKKPESKTNTTNDKNTQAYKSHQKLVEPTEIRRNTVPQKIDMATILFSDFKGFTKIAERMPADALIHNLSKYFNKFDEIVQKYDVEKINTMGDTYMCVGGIPKEDITNPMKVVAVALEMQYQLAEMQKNSASENDIWGVRIGIHTGPVIAGMVGDRKGSYDVWGDSVNIASSMESAGEVGKVTISRNTYLLVRDLFECEYRGKTAIKGDEDDANSYYYIVNGFKETLADNVNKVLPNKNFFDKIALYKFEGLQEQMYSIYEQNLPKNYYYHNIKHMIDVVVQAEIIGQAEGISDEDMYILKTAALFHDAGFIRSHKNHERVSIDIAKEMLPQEKYTEQQITTICRLIESTMLTEEPITLLEKIIRDADLDYLGRSDYWFVSRELYKELLELKLIKKNEYEWTQKQIKFLQEHTYYTNYSRCHRNPEKARHLQLMQEQLSKFNNII